ncbi:MAG: filamentous hemagglutinin N-terminal domain-containing protein [Leptolyngbya sp. UWPOB_LEPTO1]|uniref:two-partner secretion domain-containing protein n=1 Tax=Leptolyngbya sp. UWPOB_LEPTO1 TaxID=2815653 RepID=UPI001AC6AD30|nr:filamentous hemagglutinin N-terminal domain-containing protein [Leptolyngbya sp. UWPOB_LEPTO1]MBN8564229.1 filamentous hemagglutinin N-terminal domain-containing protein [Leptolyngbya sp. UWPOB_LEPTO1]
MKLSLGSGWLKSGFSAFVSIFTVAIAAEIANAQVIPDGTLGTEGSIVTEDVIRGGISDRIPGGARRGQNLFHSFSQFDVLEGRSAYFENPTGVQNIFSRVTGSDRTEIFGRLGVIQAGSTEVLGTANLFFVNPNGILFGATGSLDVGGSFVATTANAIGFGDRGNFSAANPEAPTQLLTINPSALLFNQIPTGNIINNSTASTGNTKPLGVPIIGLQVPNGQSLALIGGEVNLDGGRLNAIGGQIALGGLASLGVVSLEVNNNTFNLSFPSASQLSNVFLSNDATVNVRGTEGGNITVNANTFSGTTGGRLTAGSDGTGDGGNITINANQVSFGGIGRSGVLSGIYQIANRSGSAGDILISTKTLNAEPGAQIYSFVESGAIGNAGNLTISADSIEMSGTLGSRATRTRIASETSGIGNSGNVSISARQLTIRNGAILSTNTLPGSQGQGGILMVNVSDFVRLSGVTEQGVRAAIAAQTGGGGRGGSVEIKTRQLSIENGPIISVNAIEGTTGQAGNLTINASDSVQLIGVSSDGRNRSALAATTAGSGRGGDIGIRAKKLVVQNGGIISASAIRGSSGSAGNITIQANSLSLTGITDSSDISTVTSGRGNAGSITIRANDSISLIGQSYIFSQVESGGQGNGGDINITTRTLSLLDGGEIATSVFRAGNGLLGGQAERAGDVYINASEFINIDGIGSTGFSSGIFANTQRGASGRGGNINIATGHLRIANGAVITAQTLNNSDSGKIEINANSLEALGGGQIVANTLSGGNAGDIRLHVRDVVISGLDPNYDSRLSQFPDAPVANTSANSGIFASAESSSTGDGGSIGLSTTNLKLRERARISAQSLGQGTAGSIELNVRDRLELINSSIITAAPNSSGGNISINTEKGFGSGIVVLRNSDITTESGTNLLPGSIIGDGGNITILGAGVIALGDSNIIARALQGRGGNITLSTFFSETLPPGNSDQFEGNGRVDVNARGTVSEGRITTGDTTLIQNSLSELQQTAIDPDTLIANSCIARTEQGGTFLVTGAEGLRDRPGDPLTSNYSLGSVRPLPDPAAIAPHSSNSQRSWQLGDPIVEPSGVYRLSDGRVMMSRKCS